MQEAVNIFLLSFRNFALKQIPGSVSLCPRIPKPIVITVIFSNRMSYNYIESANTYIYIAPATN